MKLLNGGRLKEKIYQSMNLFKFLKFFERDKDITYYDEFHYIFITIVELIKVLKTHNK
jgi:hypothetical protein